MPRPTSIGNQTRRRVTSRAPKAQTIPAWGNAPGHIAKPNEQGLKARPMGSIPQITFIAFHSILPEKCAEFVLKRYFAVMRFLPVDVTDQSFQIRWPNGERSITSLPRKLRQLGQLGLEPPGRGRFKFFHQLRNIRCASQSNGEMNVISNAPYAIALAAGVAGNGCKIRIERGTCRRIENRHAVLGAEDHVSQNKRERLRHRVDYKAGFQPSYFAAQDTWGVAPCWYKSAPTARSNRAERPSCSTLS